METKLIKHQWNSNLKPQPSLGFFGILKESFRTANRNRKLLFPVLVLAFLSLSQLNFAEVYLLEPMAEDFSLQLTNHPKMVQDIRGDRNIMAIYSDAINDIRKLSAVVTLSIFILNWEINLVFLIAIVSSSSKACTAKLLDPKETISNIRKSYKNVRDTSFRLVLITLALVTLGFFSKGIVSFISAAGSSASYLYSVVLSISIAALCFYVSALWMMSMVVSVLEDVGGLAAIVRAEQVIKGKRVRASLIMALAAVVYVVVRVTKDALPIYNLDKWSRVAVTIPFRNGMICILKLFIFVVFAVFYHEQKESCEEEKEGKGLYVPIAAGEVLKFSVKES